MTENKTETIIYNNESILFGERNGEYFIESSSEIKDAIKITDLPNHLLQKVIILDSINSGAGRQEDKNLYTHVIQPLFELLNVQYDYFATTSPDSINQFASNLRESKVTIIFISGDTSINEFINGLLSDIQGSIDIFTIPGGTGNSLALSLGITNQIESIKHLLISDKIDPLYLYNVKFPQGSHYLVQNEKKGLINSNLKFVVVLSWGFHASLVADSDTPELRKFGLKRFQIAAKNNLSREQEYNGVLKVNDETIKGPFAYWLLTSSSRFEPTFEISPKGDILQDNLYFVGFNTKKNDDKYILDIMHQIYNEGDHINNKGVIYKKITNEDQLDLVISESEVFEHRRFCLDGSIILIPETSDHIKISVGDNKQHNWELSIIH
ncbi:unnamed protein product [Candida verbasci]|uniref:DAGKc domain-containing protein n=1 Tax=Candida verbasci TaxID=1227364 RepID=A0A9W4TXU8_9ASCO|nr:unnamed protein product [Candida verbasci]